MTPAQVDRQEKDSFLEWRRGLADLAEKEDLLMTPFERNIEVWRQLWRVIERSHLVVQIVDARNPLRFRCEDLESYVAEIEGSEGENGSGEGKRRSLLLVNKSDLLTRAQRVAWADYFETQGLQYAFYSASNAAAAEGILSGSMTSSGPVKDEDEDTEDSESEDVSENDAPLMEQQKEEEDSRIHILTVQELEQLFIRSAPPLTGKFDCHCQGYCSDILQTL